MPGSGTTRLESHALTAKTRIEAHENQTAIEAFGCSEVDLRFGTASLRLTDQHSETSNSADRI